MISRHLFLFFAQSILILSIIFITRANYILDGKRKTQSFQVQEIDSLAKSFLEVEKSIGL